MRFGVVGTNFISKEFVRAGRTLPDFMLAGVYSRRQETGSAFITQAGGGAYCATLNDLLCLPELDAVYIASPNRLHDAQAQAALAAGKHVLLEKPACLDAERFQRLCALAEANGVVLLEAMRPAFTPGVRALKGALSAVGTVRRVSIGYCQYSSRYDKYKRGIVENAFDPSFGNGALMDLGVYCVNLLVSLFGTPESVRTVAQRLPNGLDAQGSALCVYGEMLADVSYSKIADGRRANEIQGERGTLLFDSATNPKRIRFIARDGTEDIVYDDPDREFFGMAHEISAFMRFCEPAAREARPWKQYNAVTAATLAVMDDIRAQTGVDFIRREAEQEGGMRA